MIFVKKNPGASADAPGFFDHKNFGSDAELHSAESSIDAQQCNALRAAQLALDQRDRKSTRLNSSHAT